MRNDVFMAGTGGQGVLLIGQLLMQAASDEGLQVSYFPVYSAGSAWRDDHVHGGHVRWRGRQPDRAGRPATMLLMDQLSVDVNLRAVREGGLAVINSSAGPRRCPRGDVKLVLDPRDRRRPR